MNMQKKQIILIVIALLVVSGGLLILIHNQTKIKEKLQTLITTPVQTESLISKQWVTYHNQAYHYRIDYPFGFQISRLSTPEGVAFAKSDDAWEISVHTESTLFHTLEEWIKENQYSKYKEKNNIPVIIIERDIIISGTYRGVVVRYPENGESFLKNVFFIKDGLLFQISINNPDINREHVWKSFQFE